MHNKWVGVKGKISFYCTKIIKFLFVKQKSDGLSNKNKVTKSQTLKFICPNSAHTFSYFFVETFIMEVINLKEC